MHTMLFEDMPTELKRKAVDVSCFIPYQLQDAWDRETSLQVFAWCRQQNFAILGGEVVCLPPYTEDESVYPGNWSVDRQKRETWQSFVNRSYFEACDYVEMYPIIENRESFFVPVVVSETDYINLNTVMNLNRSRNHWHRIWKRWVNNIKGVKHSLFRKLSGHHSQDPVSKLIDIKASEEDQAALKQFERTPSTSVAAYIISYHCSFSSKSAALQAADILESEGYSVDFLINGKEEGWLVRASRSIVPTLEALANARGGVESIALSVGGLYKGFETIVIKG